MTFVQSLWLANLVLLALALSLTRNVLGARPDRLRHHRRNILQSAVRDLESRPTRQELATAWERVISSLTEVPTNPDPMVEKILAIHGATDSAIERMRVAVGPHVNALNTLAAQVDERRVRPKDIVIQYPDVHDELLLDTHLIEPFVWYESIVEGRGRWGFRSAELRIIFERLRPASVRPSMRRERTFMIQQLILMYLPEISKPRRYALRCVLILKAPTIDVRSKLRQEKRRSHLQAKLKGAGVTLPEMRGGTEREEW